MKFLVPNYSCLQNPWLGGYRPQIPVLSVLNWICWIPPPGKKIPGYATDIYIYIYIYIYTHTHTNTHGRGLVTSCILVDIYRRFGRTQCFCLQGKSVSRVWEIRLRSTAVTIPRLEQYRCRHNVHLSTVLVLNDNGSTAGVTYRVWWQGYYVWRKRLWYRLQSPRFLCRNCFFDDCRKGNRLKPNTHFRTSAMSIYWGFVPGNPDPVHKPCAIKT